MMAKGYVIAHIKVHNKEKIEKFRGMAGPIISEYGGKILVVDPTPDVREGRESGIAVVIEFETIGYPVINFQHSCYRGYKYIDTSTNYSNKDSFVF